MIFKAQRLRFFNFFLKSMIRGHKEKGWNFVRRYKYFSKNFFKILLPKKNFFKKFFCRKKFFFCHLSYNLRSPVLPYPPKQLLHLFENLFSKIVSVKRRKKVQSCGNYYWSFGVKPCFVVVKGAKERERERDRTERNALRLHSLTKWRIILFGTRVAGINVWQSSQVIIDYNDVWFSQFKWINASRGNIFPWTENQMLLSQQKSLFVNLMKTFFFFFVRKIFSVYN